MINPFDSIKQKQLHKLFNRLLEGPVTNNEIIKELNIFNYTGRLSDIRKAGYMVEAKRVYRGLYKYILICADSRRVQDVRNK